MIPCLHAPSHTIVTQHTSSRLVQPHEEVSMHPSVRNCISGPSSRRAGKAAPKKAGKKGKAGKEDTTD